MIHALMPLFLYLLHSLIDPAVDYSYMLCKSRLGMIFGVTDHYLRSEIIQAGVLLDVTLELWRERIGFGLG
jgi:hypothetical protein